MNVRLSTKETLPPCPVVIGSSGSVAETVERVLARGESSVLTNAPPKWVIVLDDASADGGLSAAATVLQRAITASDWPPSVPIVRPRSALGQLNLGNQRRWISVPPPLAAGGRGVLIDRRIVEAAQRSLVCALPARSGSVRPMSVLVDFVAPRQRLAVRLSPKHLGSIAEIALTVDPSLVLMVGQLGASPLVVMTTDIVAAELVWLAIAKDAEIDQLAEIGPWEDPVIQRATELGSRLRLPFQFRFEIICKPADQRLDETLERLVAQLGSRLGVPIKEQKASGW